MLNFIALMFIKYIMTMLKFYSPQENFQIVFGEFIEEKVMFQKTCLVD
jgi:hypothetical protein